MKNHFINAPGLIILTGGRSSRMGHDKAGLPWCSGTLLSDLLRRSKCIPFWEIIIAAHSHPDRTGWPDCHCPVHITTDTYTGCGPLGGLEAALRQGSSPYYVVLSVDLPFYDFSPLQDWLAHPDWMKPNAEKIYPILLPVVQGKEQPLAAVYPAGIYPAVLTALQSGEHRVRSIYDQWPVHRIDETEHAFLYTNINTPAAYKDALAYAVNCHRTVPVLSITADCSHTGKTTAATSIIRILSERGYRIGYIKSTHHHIDTEKEGSDTDRATKSGAVFALTCSLDDIPAGQTKTAALLAASQQRPADLVIIESRHHGVFPSLQVLPSGVPTASIPDDIIAVIHTNDEKNLPAHHFSLSRPQALISYILSVTIKSHEK